MITLTNDQILRISKISNSDKSLNSVEIKGKGNTTNRVILTGKFSKATMTALYKHVNCVEKLFYWKSCNAYRFYAPKELISILLEEKPIQECKTITQVEEIIENMGIGNYWKMKKLDSQLSSSVSKTNSRTKI